MTLTPAEIIGSITVGDVDDYLGLIIQTAQDRRDNSIRGRLCVGQRVMFDAGRRGVIRGMVSKVNPKTVKVRTDEGMIWNVAHSLLTIEPASATL